MQIYSKSHIGLVRKENQDRVWVKSISAQTSIAILCDGMGGENAGSYASESAVDIISKIIRKEYNDTLSNEQVRDLMIKAVYAANEKIYKTSQIDRDKHGMGTTAVVAVARTGKVQIVNVGDSRAYLIVQNGIRQITKDHNFVSRLVDDGTITLEQAKKHPDRNRITRAVGVFEEVMPDYFEVDIEDNQFVLLCSDGLSSYVDDVETAKTVLTCPPSKACGLLIDKANQNGGRDNITVALIAF